jgi:cytochrome c
MKFDSWTFNKIAGGVLGTGLLVLALQNFSGILFHHEAPSEENPGYRIEIEEPVVPGAEAAVPLSIGTLLKEADASKGQVEAKACLNCHNFAVGAGKKVGPELYNVVERQIASMPGFEYGAAAKEKAGEKWTYDNLNIFLKAPKAYFKGTKMSWGGLKNDKKRANLIAYLATLSDAPKPFPAP